MATLSLNTCFRLKNSQKPLTISSHARTPFFFFSKGTPFLFHCQSVNSSILRSEKLTKDEFEELGYEEKMEEARNILCEFQEDDLQVLQVIDSMQHLGIDHHFQQLIESTLKQQFQRRHLLFRENYNLYEISLRFRLLRQQGYYIPSDVFTKFTNEEGKFKELRKDVNGLMALHEASHLSIQGEDILDEAARFSTESLMANMAHLDDPRHTIMVHSTLKYPHHKCLPRFTADTFIKNLKVENDWERNLVSLATMDFRINQSVYQEEIRHVLRWWKGLGLMDELAKNRQLKWYTWSLALIPDPFLSRERIELTKPIALVYLIDDIIDVHATFDQIIQLAKVVNRWEMSVAEGLPEYMTACLAALFDTTYEINNLVFQKYGWNPIDHLKKAWANLFDAYIIEAKWFANGNSPTADEYLRTAIMTTGVPMVLINTFFLLGHGASTGTTNIEGIITSAGTILRLLDDLDAIQDEIQEGNDASYVEYYVKEQQNVSISDGKQHVRNMVSEEWKILNKQCLSPTPIPTSFGKSCLNVARMVPMMYNYSESHCLPILEKQIMSMGFPTLNGTSIRLL